MAALGNPPTTQIVLVLNLKIMEANSNHSKTRLTMQRDKEGTLIDL
jgi:hypothetical protein